MKDKLILGAGMLVLAVAVGVVLLSAGLAQAPAEVAPDKVVSAFYGWYLDAIGEPGMRQNPLVDRAYRSREFLSPAFIAEVDETLDSFNRGGFDPSLLAQDVPVRIAVDEPLVAGEEASVTVEMFWGGNNTPTERLVTLELIDGEWRIVGVSADPS